MAAKTVLQLERFTEEPISIEVENGKITIYNKATDATAWCVNISLSDWEEIKKFVNDKTINNGSK